MDISGNWKGKTLTKHLMDKYDEFAEKEFLREEEYREKIVLLCKNKNYALNKDDGVKFPLSTFPLFLWFRRYSFFVSFVLFQSVERRFSLGHAVAAMLR